jgi:hypothetical protein
VEKMPDSLIVLTPSHWKHIAGRCASVEGDCIETTFPMFYLCGVGKPRLSLLMTVFVVDSRDILVPIGFHVIDLMDGLNGLPKIAACAELVSVLRISGTKTLKKICGLRLN